MVQFSAGFRLAFVLSLAFAPVAYADSPPVMPPALASLETMVQNMGYTTTDGTDKQTFSIAWQGKYNYTIGFDVSQDATIAYAYVDLTIFTSTQIRQLQFTKILEASDVSDFYFSMENKADGEAIFANAVIPLGGLTPQDLRSTLTGFVNRIDSSDTLWDTNLWK